MGDCVGGDHSRLRLARIDWVTQMSDIHVNPGIEVKPGSNPAAPSITPKTPTGPAVAPSGPSVKVPTINGVPTVNGTSEDVWGRRGNNTPARVSGSDNSEAKAAAEAAAALAKAREEARNEGLHRGNDKKIAEDARKIQRERRDASTDEDHIPFSSGVVIDSDDYYSAPATSLEVGPKSVLDLSNTGTASDYDTETEYDDDVTLDEMMGLDYDYDNLEDVGSEGMPLAMPEWDPATQNVMELFKENPEMFPRHAREVLGDLYQRQNLADMRRLQAEDDARYEADRRTERLAHASDVGRRQRQRYNGVYQMFNDKFERLGKPLGKSRYMTPAEIRDSITGTYVSTPAAGSNRTFKFEGDESFEVNEYKTRNTDKIRRQMSGVDDSTLSDLLGAGEQSPSTSFEAQRHGSIDFDPDSTVSDNVMNTEKTVLSNAMLISHPLMIKWGNERVDIREKTKKGAKAVLRFNNTKGRDVEGAIGRVRGVYGCSINSVLSMVVQRLGLGVDTNGKICGKDVNDFVLDDLIIIEACNDIVASAQKNGGMPFAIVQGTPYGGDLHTRDDTGMFPILGGTRCIPMGHLLLDVFEDCSRDPKSPLHGMSPRQFYAQSIEMFLNDVQPVMMANATGPLAYQTVAWNLANEAALTIDGIPNEIYNIPEHQVARMRSVMQAELAEAGDLDSRDAMEQKLKNMPVVMSRFANRQFKDGGARDSKGNVVGPGSDPRVGPAGAVIRTLTSMTAAARCCELALSATGMLEGAWTTAQQQAVVSFNNVMKDHVYKKAWHFGTQFDKTDFLSETIGSKEALEAIEVYMTLFRIGGRDMVDAFRYDRNDRMTSPRYHATKKDMRDFLERWGVSQGGDVSQLIKNAMSFMQFGDGMFKGTKAQQFMDMALYEMMQNRLHGGEVLDSSQLEEIARSGQYNHTSAGEALVSALMDSSAGYEAFKTMDYTAASMTNPWCRAVDIVMDKNGVTSLLFRKTICMFPRFRLGSIQRTMPLTRTISYITSSFIKKGMMKESEAMGLCNDFAVGFSKVADTVSRISNYQVGMDSADVWVGLRKNLAYDIVTFGGNYIMMAALNRAIHAILGGIEPPEDEEKITLPWEWRMRSLGVPIKWAWFMDDLMGCGAPLAYAWEIAEGYDVTDEDGNKRHVEAYSDEAVDTAWHAYKNMMRSFSSFGYIMDGIDFLTNFKDNFDELCGKDLWRQPIGSHFENFLEGVDEEMAEYYQYEEDKPSVSEMRREWMTTRIDTILMDFFGDMTPRIISEIMPGTRDSIMQDRYEHSTSLEYDYEKYGKERAENEWRVKGRSYHDWQRCLRTQDNWLQAFISDLFAARDENSTGYQYTEMPIATSTDARYRGSDSIVEQFELNLTLPNGNDNLDLNNDGKTDTRDERQEVLFHNAEELCDYVDEHYIATNKYPEYAVADGFVIPADARLNAINYCYYMIGTKNNTGAIMKDFYRRKEEAGGWLPQEEWNAAQAEWNKYNTILQQYLKNEDIPWRVPRYAKLASDTETMYVDKQGRATDVLDPNAIAIPYRYGNQSSPIAPLYSPTDQGNYDFQPFTWDTRLDENGTPENRQMMERIYDQAAAAGTVSTGYGKGREALDVMTAGGAIERGEAPVPFDERGWEVFEGTYPDWLDDPTKDTIDKMYGIDSYMPDEETNPDGGEDVNKKASNTNNGRGGGSRGYYRRSYSYPRTASYSSGYSNYNPRIYSSPRQVYSQRASGLSTRSPYKATSTYLRPAFYTSGSRKSYRRQN